VASVLGHGLSTVCAHYSSCFLSSVVSCGDSNAGGKSENEDTYIICLTYFSELIIS
jgi:hypothetical protein